MKIRALAFASVLATFTVSAQGACIYPRPPADLPDGRTATYEEMVEAQKAVKQFDADVAAYNSCLDMELQAIMSSTDLDDARKAELAEMQAKKNNAAVDEVQAVADRFNEQLRAYKDANKKE